MTYLNSQHDVMLTTAEAASLIRHSPKTLYQWACYQTGPVRPVKVQRKLLWRLSDLQALLNGGAK
ncbi:helix-turn-helix domain-containing protein [Paraburkholderia saeva]|uniref:Helix-turn-helix domain-containing protein n=1 Tax=Paraburkholderia saeva TaxID=2777537 RepID=A0A9N8X0R4_9BURK|nr:helix-turn-helix domain-containing protein [Paraburkholderia saeva]CAG4892244.1 hypothetical protein LMG31841_01582 [Paraburkholderia saeva]